MNEIEKMYENVGIEYEERYNNCTLNKEVECKLKCSCDICKYSEERYIYPPFTAEKQIEIENVIFRHNYSICELERNLGTEFNNGKFVKHYFVWHYMAQDDIRDDYYFEYSNCDRGIALAGFVNSVWKDLAEEERKQIKEILK